MNPSHKSQSMAILTNEEVRELERDHAQAHPRLMLRAGQAAADVAMQILASSSSRSVLVVCGPGNNGGDGFVVATCLLMRGYPVKLVSRGEPERLSEDARAAREGWLSAGGSIAEDFAAEAWGLVVDALFGIGLARPASGVYADWIFRVNALACPILSLDVPSGLDSASGAALGPVVRASHTATFIALKPGLLTLDGPDHCGTVSVHDLSLPIPALALRRVTTAHFCGQLVPRRKNVHKGCFGALGVIGGAAGMLGAALLASRAALRLGAGKVFMGPLDPRAPQVDPLYPEIMVRAPESLLEQVTALAVGPGLGSSQEAEQLLLDAIDTAWPVVVDADGLNLLASNAELRARLGGRAAPAVLTPHPAEAARMLGFSVTQVQADRIASARRLAERFGAIIVLKGCGSVIATPGGRWFINTSGHAGMASAGMGDVLTGLIGSLLAQNWPALAATLAAVHLHGAAAERLMESGVGPVGLTAGETIGAAQRLFNAWLSAPSTAMVAAPAA